MSLHCWQCYQWRFFQHCFGEGDCHLPFPIYSTKVFGQAPPFWWWAVWVWKDLSLLIQKTCFRKSYCRCCFVMSRTVNPPVILLPRWNGSTEQTIFCPNQSANVIRKPGRFQRRRSRLLVLIFVHNEWFDVLKELSLPTFPDFVDIFPSPQTIVSNFQARIHPTVFRLSVDGKATSFWQLLDQGVMKLHRGCFSWSGEHFVWPLEDDLTAQLVPPHPPGEIRDWECSWRLRPKDWQALLLNSSVSVDRIAGAY